MLCALGERTLGTIDHAATSRVYETGDRLFYEGEPPLAVFCINQGCVRLSKATANGEDLTLGFLSAGEIAGVEAAIAQAMHDVTAVATERTIACILPWSVLEELFTTSPTAMLALFRRTIRRLNVLRGRLVELAFTRMPHRLASTLLTLVEDFHGSEEPATLPVGRSDLAQMVGCTPETVSRILHALAERGVVRLSRSGIEVLDRGALQALAHDEGELVAEASRRRHPRTGPR